MGRGMKNNRKRNTNKEKRNDNRGKGMTEKAMGRKSGKCERKMEIGQRGWTGNGEVTSGENYKKNSSK